MSWADRAKAHFSDSCPHLTDKTDENPLLSVSSVPTRRLYENTPGVSSVLSVGGGSFSEKEAANDAAPELPESPDWRELDKAYQAHHWTCPTCCAAGRLRDGSRCALGLPMWQAYEDACRAGGWLLTEAAR